MGVPAFFRWLSRKYPSVIVPCVEQKPVDVNGVLIPINSSEPNPNGVEFDNLYLDMNGIIHPCTHPEDRPAPKNEDEMMIAIFECIDRLFKIVRPRKLLYMAIDGVAPRAKMNQQRSRRFRAAKEAFEKMQEVKRIRAELLLKGIKLPDEKPKEEHFDSNCITPGTPFMAKLSQCLHYYIHERLNNDPGWENVKVILSDANVPGEGEHKIMDFIRKQRAQPNHDPNTQHCLCGADADLIMLGLATHEPNFTIIREEFKPNKPRPCEICGQIGHEMKECTGGCQSEHEQPADVVFGSETEFIFVRLNVLKEYLERELYMPNLPFRYDFERVVDDWVFMCFFVGNDFLPHLPSLEIRENAIDRLIGLYKDCVYKTGGYLTDSGDVNLERVQLIMYELGKVEDQIFKSRQQRELMFKARDKAKRQRSDEYSSSKPNWSLVHNTQFAPKRIDEAATVTNARNEAYDIRRAGMNTVSAKTALESMLDTAGPSKELPSGTKRSHDDDNEDDSDDDQAHDEVRLWENGFKERYYESKFDVSTDELEFRHCVALNYVRGLCWVLKYYYQGCPSWKWYFPYHYAPFASDFYNICGLSTEFDTDTVPFNPLEQLMSVFPAASSKHVPKPWAELMTSPDSPIIDFYPEDFKIDLNGKKFAWQGVALLPFVDENRLFNALKPYYSLLTESERKRNMRGDDRLYMSLKHKNSDLVISIYKQSLSIDIESEILSEGMKGTMLAATECVKIGGYLHSPVKGLAELRGNTVCCVRFRDPKYSISYKFMAKKLRGAIDPPRVLKPEDLTAQQNKNWRAQIGMAPATQRAYLDTGGHRMVNYHTGNYQQQQQGPRMYGNVPFQYSSNASRGGCDNSYQRSFGSRGQAEQVQNRGYSTQPQNQNAYPRGHGNYRPRHSHPGPSRGSFQGPYQGNQGGYSYRGNPGPYRGWNGQGNRFARR